MESIVIDGARDTRFKDEIAARPGGANIRKCFACGTCTAGCPAFQADAVYNPRRIIRRILLGMREEVLSSPSIWLCHQCYACSANCPQDVDFSHIMMAIRDIAVAEGYHPPGLPRGVEVVGQAANSFRRDCVRFLTGETDLEALRRGMEEALEAVQAAKGEG